MTPAESFVRLEVWSDGPEGEFPIRLAAWISRKPAACGFTVYEITRDATAVAKLIGQDVEPEDEAAVRLAAQLAREPASIGMTAQELAREAKALAGHAFAARRALEAGKNPARHVARVAETLVPYHARVVDNRDVNGMVLGIRWHSCTYTSGFSNIFFVA